MAYHPEKSSLGVTEVPCFFEMLPFDIVHDIFVLSDDPASDTKLHGTPIVISHVCKRWREYALIIPALWNALRFHPAGLSNGWQDQLVFLERSQEAPLDIEIRSARRNELLGIPVMKQILQLLLPHVHRWRSLEIHLHIKPMRVLADRLRHTRAAGLERLIVEAWGERPKLSRWRCCLFGGGLPNLRYWSTPIQLLPPSSSLVHDFHKLQELHLLDHYNIRLGLDRPTPGDIINILSRCSGLEQLTLMHDDNSKSLPSTDSSNEPIHLPNLVSFRFGSSPHISTPRPSFIKICSGIRAPLVENINCPTLSNSFLPLIGNANPFPGLQKLRLHHHGWSAGERDLQFYRPGVFENAFFNLQSLSNLVFLRQKIPTCAFRALHHHCPILIHLALDGCDFITADCVKLVEARKKSSAVTSLQRLRIQDRQYNIPSPPDRSQEAIWFRANVTEFFYGSFEGGFRDA